MLIKLLAIPATAAIVLAGLWVTGGAITNDFALAQGLSAAWMGLAGGAALAVAVRSRALRWPVLGSYVVTAAVAGAFLGSSWPARRAARARCATTSTSGL